MDSSPARAGNHPEKKYNIPDQRIIGKQSENNPEKMIPNENYKKYFGEDFREIWSFGERKYFWERESGLVEDMVAYSITSKNNAAWYYLHYPIYAYNHPLFNEKMRIYSDTKVSEFHVSVTDGQRISLVNDWNEKKGYSEREAL